MAADLYTVVLGSYTFGAAPGFTISTTDVTRRNATPNVLVARNYTWRMRCRVRSDSDTASVTALQSFLTAAVNARVLPTLLQIKNQAGTAMTGVGDVRTGTSEEWEDLSVTDFELEDRDGQLVAGSWFTLGFYARRSFPDTNGICEFEQEYIVEEDDLNREVRRLTTTIRLAKSSSNTIVGTSAVYSQLRLDAPVGWTRTQGKSPLGFTYRYPLYPLLHLAECLSEVTKNNGVAAPNGASEATTGQRVVDVPEKGIRRVTDTAETTGSDDPLAWVEENEPSEIVSADTTVDTAKKTARGEWKRIEPLAVGSKTTKVTRTYSMTGGRRQVGAIEMTPPVRPKIQRGAFAAWKLTESIEVRAGDAKTLSDFTVPDPLGAPWVLGPVSDSLPRVEEDAIDPSMRLWLWVVTREYWWDSEDVPLADPALVGAVFAAASETTS